jgi:hypothetical protein
MEGVGGGGRDGLRCIPLDRKNEYNNWIKKKERSGYEILGALLEF